MKSYDEFFAWCDRQGLKTDRLIALAFGMTPQTVRNWKALRKDKRRVPKAWLELACLGYEMARAVSEELIPPFPLVSSEWFDIWRREHGQSTLEHTGHAFGVTRQAVHNWRIRKRLPRWLPIACVGFQRKALESRTQGPEA